MLDVYSERAPQTGVPGGLATSISIQLLVLMVGMLPAMLARLEPGLATVPVPSTASPMTTTELTELEAVAAAEALDEDEAATRTPASYVTPPPDL